MTGAILAAEVAEAAARAGGAVLMRFLRDQAELEIGYKDARANLVTAADRESQQAVTETILTAFPDHAVDGEEGAAGTLDAADVWYVDPLDGTTNFTHGLPFFCVSVALRSRGTTVAGAIYDPLRDEMFVGVLAGGATLNGVPIGVSDIARLDRALVVAQAQTVDPGEIRGMDQEEILNYFYKIETYQFEKDKIYRKLDFDILIGQPSGQAPGDIRARRRGHRARRRQRPSRLRHRRSSAPPPRWGPGGSSTRASPCARSARTGRGA